MERLGLEPGRADRWRPWRAYAALHLWAALAGPPGAAETATQTVSPGPAGPSAYGRGAGTSSVMPAADLAAT
jgi:hypothetical protein